MCSVVPASEGQHPFSGLIDRRKAVDRVVRPVLAGPEQRFCVGIVVADSWSTERWGHTRPARSLEHAGAFHGTAIIRVQYQRLCHNAFCQTGLVDQSCGQITGFTLVDLPGNDLAAVKIQDQVKIIEPSTGRTRQPGDAPAPDLIGAGGTVGARGLALWFLATASVVVLICFSQYTVEGGLRGQVAPLTGQCGYDLARWQAVEHRAVADGQDHFPFLGTEFVGWDRALSAGTAIT